MPSIFYLFTVENLNMDTKKFMVISSTFKFLNRKQSAIKQAL